MKQNLTTTNSITSTYAGEASSGYIMATLLAAPTLGNGTITIKPNIKYKSVIKKGLTSGLIGANSCDFTSTGAITLVEKILEPVTLTVQMEVCKEPFRQDWAAIDMGFGTFDNLPKDFTDFLIGNISATIAADLEVAIWQYNTVMSGFTVAFKLDNTVVDISGTTISPSNVIGELTKVATAAAALNVYSASEKPKIYAATNVVNAYLIALGGFGANGLGANGINGAGPNGLRNDMPLYFSGLEIVNTPGLNSSEMVVSQASNLVFGTGILNDTNSVKVLDMSELDGSDNVRFIAKWTAGVVHLVGAEIVYYWIY